MSEGVPDPLIGQVLDGRYAITRRLGTGGMGAVYEAEQRRLGRKVAIKTIHAHLATKGVVVERFRREAMAAASAGSQHIVDVYDLGVMASGVPYMVMELIEGTDLRTLIETQGRMATSTAAHVVRQACDALEAAHEVGIIHRDVKPENIMITRRRNDPMFVKVVDFGISKLRDSSLTGSHELLGTPYAMAPEQLRGAGHVDARCDVYGLGICLYYALSGDIPYEADTLPLLIAQISAGQRVPLKSRVRNLPTMAYDLVATATARDPDQRFRSMSAFAAALRTLENAAPDGALAPTAPTKQPPKPQPPRVAPRPAPKPASLVEPKRAAVVEPKREAVRARDTTERLERLPTTFGSKVFRLLIALALIGGIGVGAYFGLERWQGSRAASVDAGVSLDASLGLDAAPVLVELDAGTDAGSEPVVQAAVATVNVEGLEGAEVHAGERSCTTPCSLALPEGVRAVRVVYAGRSLSTTIEPGAHRTLALGAARVTAEGAHVVIGPHVCEGPCVVPLPAGEHVATASRESSHAESPFTVRAGETTRVGFLLMPSAMSASSMPPYTVDSNGVRRVRNVGRVRFRLIGEPIAIRVAGQTCHTPCTLELPEGEHTVQATREGRTSRHRITVRAGRTVDAGINPPRMSPSMMSRTGTLTIAGRGAIRVQVLGRSCAPPCTLELPPGNHTVHISFASNATTRQVRVRAGETVRLSVAGP